MAKEYLEKIEAKNNENKNPIDNLIRNLKSVTNKIPREIKIIALIGVGIISLLAIINKFKK